MKTLPELPNISASGAPAVFVAGLSIGQADLATRLLLDQLAKIESSDAELDPLMGSNANLFVQVKTGQVRDINFLEELEAVRGVIKNEPKFIAIIDTIIALWNG